MSETEVDFETTDSPNWPEVKDGARQLAYDHLNERFQAATTATAGFVADAHQLVDNTITKPPGHISPWGAILDIVSAACDVIIPEEALVAQLVYKGMKSAWEEIKTTEEVAEQYHQQVEADSVDAARQYLGHAADSLAEMITRSASRMIERSKEGVDPALEEYVRANPQVFRRGDSEYYDTLCRAIGVERPDQDLLATQMINATMDQFRRKVEEVAATLHFFHGMDTDRERLDFLMDIAEQGTDPDAFIRLIGADQAYWDQFLSAYRSGGRDAAHAALIERLGLAGT